MTITGDPQGKSPAAKSSGYWQLVGMALLCQVILKNHAIKGLCDFMDRSCQIWWLKAVKYKRYKGFCLSHNHARPGDQSVI